MKIVQGVLVVVYLGDGKDRLSWNVSYKLRNMSEERRLQLHRDKSQKSSKI
jgi:hypothetical protein